MSVSLLGFHALTGCDSTSQFAGISKKSAWKIFKEEARLLNGLGKSDQIDSEEEKDIEEFVCKLYQKESIISTVQDKF